MRAYASLALAMILVGLNVPVGKAVIAHLPVFLFLALRCIVACAVLLPLLRWRGELARPRGRQFRDFTIQALFGVFLFTLFMLLGVERTGAVEAGKRLWAGALDVANPAAALPRVADVVETVWRPWRQLGLPASTLGALRVTPSDGLSGHSPSSATAVLARLTQVADGLNQLALG